MTKRILSGIQSTGNLQLGNYLGAIRNWVKLQEDAECFLFAADLHSLTVFQNPKDLRQNTKEAIAMYLACGISEERAALFPQSMIPEHAELMWVLSCHTSLGWLNRMTQFKEKAGKKRDQANAGLYTYPILMAADILLYKPNSVPVGDDQKQHVEIARDIAGAFNRAYKKDLFVLPEFCAMGPATRVMSLKDGTSKMSKSDPSDASRINLKDDPDTIAQKIKKAKTDSGVFPSSSEETEGRPEVQNLINIYCALTEKTPEYLYQDFGGKNFSPFKEHLADACIETLKPMREKFVHLMNHEDHLKAVIDCGVQKARTVAEKTMADVKETIGL
jgi:tryptophanyl-tRNA synthetase